MTSERTERPDLAPLSEEAKATYRTRLRFSLFRKLRALYRQRKQAWGLTQRDLAARLNTDPAVISRRLKGEENVTLDWVCDFARAMDARVDVKITPLSEVERPNYSFNVWEQSRKPGVKNPVSSSRNIEYWLTYKGTTAPMPERTIN